MKFLKIFLLVAIVYSCAPVKVHYDYDKTIDFTKYNTYNYYDDLQTGLSELDAKRLLAALDDALRVKGFTLSDTPDFYVDINSSVFENMERNTVGIGIGGTGRHVGGGVSVGVPLEGARFRRQIIFDFVDEHGKGLIWQAVSESGYNQKASPEAREARLRMIVKEVLSGFPPGD